MRVLTLLTVSALSFAVAAPALAQDTMGMKSDSMMKMSAMETKKMNHCNAMSHDMMTKSKSCMKMMKMHPDMMKGNDSTMAH